MNYNPWIALSRRIYSRLLGLYPKEHISAYGADMLQVFTDQCKAVDYSERKWERFALWLRTLIDVVITAFREHISSPRAALGLIDSTPESPLPWKGVVLVLIPGLIFFVCQVAQLTGKDWFFLMIYRAAYFLIIPVLVVWIWKRRFPIWGLMPLGLLFNTLLWLGYRLGYRWNWLTHESSPPLQLLGAIANVFPFYNVQKIFVFGLLISIPVLMWLVHRRMKIPAVAWGWSGLYVLLAVIDVSSQYQNFVASNIAYEITPATNLDYLSNLAYFDFYMYGGLLVLILLGALLALRHGRLAMLLPLGYLLPTVIYGRVSNDWPSPATAEFSFMLTVGATALTYRFLVALAAPLWIMRSTTSNSRKIASAASLAVLWAIQMGFSLYLALSFGFPGNQLSITFNYISEQLITGSGIALAWVLYRTIPAQEKPQRDGKINLDGAAIP